MSSEQKPRLVKPDAEQYYDIFARTGCYDSDSEAVNWPVTTDVLIGKSVEAKPDGRIQSVLDLAAGTGLTIGAIKKRIQPERIMAVDRSEEMLGLFRQKSIADGVEIKKDTVQHYADTCGETFDLVTFFSAAEYLPNLPFTLRKIAGLLNENGALAFTYQPQREGQTPEIVIDHTDKLGAAVVWYRWPSAEIEQTLTDCGLAIAENLDVDSIGQLEGLDYRFIAATKLSGG